MIGYSTRILCIILLFCVFDDVRRLMDFMVLAILDKYIFPKSKTMKTFKIGTNFIPFYFS